MEPIEFKDIKYILAVEKAGSFSRAAEKEYISQPALSRIVKKVEQELGLMISVFLCGENCPEGQDI